MFKTLATTLTATAMMAGVAMAQTTALNPEPWPMMDGTEMSDDARGIFADEDGNMRTFEDFAARFSAADDGVRDEARQVCEAYATDDTVTSLRVRNRCLSVNDQ